MEVDSARMTLHPQAHSVDLEWASARYGDAALVPPGTEFILPENLTLHEVIDLGSDSTGRTAVDLRFGLNLVKVLCTGATFSCCEIPSPFPKVSRTSYGLDQLMLDELHSVVQWASIFDHSSRRRI